MNKLVKSIRRLIFGIGLYILFFNPNLVIVGSFTVKLLFPIVLVYGIMHYKQSLMALKKTYIESLLLVSILCYTVVLLLFVNGDIEIFKGIVMLVVGCLLIPTLIYALKNTFSNVEIVWLIVNVGIAATIISCICFVFPDFNSSLREFQFSSSYNLVDLSFRGFGISNGLFFYYPIVLSLILIIYLEIASITPLKYLTCILFVIAIFINARIGIFPLGVYCIVKSLKSIRISISIIISCAILMLGVWYVGYKFGDTTFGFICKWILGGVGQITNPILGTGFETFGEQHFNTLGEKMLFLPDGIENVFWGTGINLFGRPSLLKSDVGYTIQLYYGGIVLLSMILILICIMFNRLSHALDRCTKIRTLVISLFASTLFIANFKGDFLFQMNSGFLFLYFCYVFILSCKNQNFLQLSQSCITMSRLKKQ